MRSSTDPNFLDRCRQCFLQQRVCICPHIHPIEAPFEVLIVRHWKEAWRSSNTGRLATLAITNCTVVDYGSPGGDFDPSPLQGEGVRLLFPSLDRPDEPLSVNLSPSVPLIRLVVLDSTWSQARKLVRRIPGLKSLPRVQVLPTDPPPARLRTPPTPTGMGTFEAIARAVEVCSTPETGRQLDALHDRFVRHAVAQRGGGIIRE
jgi:DTW domain-containing protein